MVNHKRSRPSKHEHFMNRARVVAERSTCLRRKVGAIIVDKEGVQISDGYSGAPRGMAHCLQTGKCLRIQLSIPSGQRYELCRSVHAEQNAIINAARTGTSIVDGEMYISSEKIKDAYSNEEDSNEIYGPCILCRKEIINAGLKRVYMREEGVGEKEYSLEDLKELLIQEETDWRERLEGFAGSKRSRKNKVLT